MAEQTDDYYSEQTWSCTAEGEPGEENGPDEASGYCPGGGHHEQRVVKHQIVSKLKMPSKFNWKECLPQRNVTCNLLHVTCHESCVTWHLDFLFGQSAMG